MPRALQPLMWGLLCSAAVAAQAPRLQPADFDLGTLRQGAWVEADFIVYWKPGTQDPTKISPTAGVRVHRLQGPQIPPTRLAAVDVVLLAQGGTARLSKTDIALLQGFICGGGRVVVFASKFMAGSITPANQVLKPFGLAFLDQEGQPGKPFEANAADLAQHPLTRGVNLVKTRRPTPIQVTTRSQALVGIPDHEDLAFVARAASQSGGEVLAVGAPVFWMWADQGSGNLRLFRNLLARPRPQC